MTPLKPYSKQVEMDKIKEMLERKDLKLRTIERWVLSEYYKSLENENKV